MAATNTHSTLTDSWVVSGLDESTVIVENNASTPAASFSSENLTPISSYSESELIGDYQEERDTTTSSAANIPTKLSDSTSSLTSSTSSGPELIMPSIMFESRASEQGSWVIPRKRSKQSLYESRKAPRLPKARNHASASGQEQHHDQHHQQKSDKPPAAAQAPTTAHPVSYIAQLKNYLATDVQRYESFRLILNLLLALMVMHLLIFPEVVHQAPVICRVPAISKVYSQTCERLNRSTSTTSGLTADIQSSVRTQNQLQIYLNQTIEELAPVDSSLKDSDVILRGIYTEIRKEYGSARHEIELEFEGIWAASRSITRALANLKFDIKATVDVFQKPNTYRPEYGKGGSRQQGSGNIFTRLLSRGLSEADTQEANGIAAMNQFGRLNQELDSAIARLEHKTHTLLQQLAKLDDHLQSITKLTVREKYRLNPQQQQQTDQVESVWATLSGLIHRSQLSATDTDEKENTVLKDLERIASNHNLIADVVGRLDKELKALRKIRAIRA